jgi:hypothetical protein
MRRNRYLQKGLTGMRSGKVRKSGITPAAAADVILRGIARRTAEVISQAADFRDDS